MKNYKTIKPEEVWGYLVSGIRVDVVLLNAKRYRSPGIYNMREWQVGEISKFLSNVENGVLEDVEFYVAKEKDNEIVDPTTPSNDRSS